MSTKVDNILLIEGSKESVAEAAKLILFRSHAYPELESDGYLVED